MDTQKIQASKNVKGFTLVELIVVITILAILGTIAFLSLQGQSASARDSKRKTDLSSITTRLLVTQVGWSTILGLITPVPAELLSTINIAGGNATAGINYQAGTPNFSAFSMNTSDFKDPDGINTYKIGGTTLDGGAFQLAATMENDASGNPTKTALVTGNYRARTIASPDVSAKTSTGSAISGNSTDVNIVLDNADIGKFKINDTILETGICTTWAKVISISSNLQTIIVRCTGGVTAPGAYAAGTLQLKLAETGGLISIKGGTSTTPVTNGDTTASNMPY